MTDPKDQELAELRQRVASLEAGMGTPDAPEAAKKPEKKSGFGRVMLWIIGIVVALAMAGSLVPHRDSTPANTTTSAARDPPATTTTTSSGNLLNDRLRARSSAEQAGMLGKIVGERCQGRKAFYMGTGHAGMSNSMSYWSLACRDGRRYLVQISPDDKNNSVMECSIYERIAGGHCFKKFDGN